VHGLTSYDAALDGRLPWVMAQGFINQDGLGLLSWWPTEDS